MCHLDGLIIYLYFKSVIHLPGSHLLSSTLCSLSHLARLDHLPSYIDIYLSSPSLSFCIFSLKLFFCCCHGSSIPITFIRQHPTPLTLLSALIPINPSLFPPSPLSSPAASNPECQNLLFRRLQVSFPSFFFSCLLPAFFPPYVDGFVCWFHSEAPVAVQAQDQKIKPECFGVFCTTYDLKAVSLIFPVLLLLDSATVCLNWETEKKWSHTVSVCFDING